MSSGKERFKDLGGSEGMNVSLERSLWWYILQGSSVGLFSSTILFYCYFLTNNLGDEI